MNTTSGLMSASGTLDRVMPLDQCVARKIPVAAATGSGGGVRRQATTRFSPRTIWATAIAVCVAWFTIVDGERS